MKNEQISFKDLSKGQLSALKELYIDSRINSMSEIDLRTFAREVLDLQISGTVGNEEEREAWKEMKSYFGESFEQKIKDIIKVKGEEEATVSTEEKEFHKRLEALDRQKKDEAQMNEDMW